MSFDIQSAYFYGAGTLGNVENPQGQLSSYASVTAISTSPKTITIDLANASAGAYEQFVAGTEIFLHISGVKNDGNALYLGRYKFAKIVSVDSNVLTLDKKPLNLDPTKYFYQVLSVPQFQALTLSNTISPPAFDETNGYGGLLVLQCSDKLVMSGKINLVDKGLITSDYRPLLNQEQNGTKDTDIYSGFENYETAKHFALNVGDGAAFIVAKAIDFEGTARIGNPLTKGVQRCRGAIYSLNAPEGITNVGGSTILLAAETITGFSPDVIAKYRNSSLSTGKGLCRAYIATESTLPNDEGLYAYDIINTPDRLQKDTFIDVTNGFGSGVSANARAPLLQQNNYASVTKISGEGKVFTVTGLTTAGYAQFDTGAMVMVHASTKKASAVKNSGRFFLSNIVGIKKSSTSHTITLDKSINDLKIGNFTIDNYNFQIISIPQYNNFTLNDTNDKTPKYENGMGGIFAIAVNGTCDLSGGKILVEGKGGAVAYGKTGLNYISNANMKNRLPIGEGHGSVFILAREIVMNDSTRIGASYSGAELAPKSYGVVSQSFNLSGGWCGKNGTNSNPSTKVGSGLAGGVQDEHNGGFGCNSSDGTPQGAHIFIVANKITGFNVAAISTGGQGCSKSTIAPYSRGRSGGAGYGGSGGGARYYLDRFTKKTGYMYGTGGGVVGGGAGVHGNLQTDVWLSGGGSSGFAFIYCNGYASQSTSNLIFD